MAAVRCRWLQSTMTNSDYRKMSASPPDSHPSRPGSGFIMRTLTFCAASP